MLSEFSKCFQVLIFSFQTEVELDPNVNTHFSQESPLTLLLKAYGNSLMQLIMPKQRSAQERGE